MFNWNIINKTYVYDGTFEGLLSMVFDCYIKKVIPLRIVSKNRLEINFLDTIEEIKTDEERRFAVHISNFFLAERQQELVKKGVF